MGLISSAVFRLLERKLSTPPDLIIGATTVEDAYLLRWYVIPRNKWFNIYFHKFQRSDDDRALHDHPWWWCSWLLRGYYIEHSFGGTKFREPGSLKFSWPTRAHRVELVSKRPAYTLFITGPVLRSWYFYCPQGRVHWRDFTGDNEDGTSTAGKGCNQ